ncbi:MAG: TrkH family potassium uptake protein [Pontiellaceae bacterium]
MNSRSVFHLISYLTFVIGITMVICGGISRIYNESILLTQSFLTSGIITLIFSFILGFFTKGNIHLSRRDGFGVVTFGWIIITLFGSLPYILSGVINHPVSALFETMSGFTTTGASVLSNLEMQPKSILLWRSLTQWLGGMGVIVLCVAILPFLGVGGMQIFRAEMPGPSKDRLTPRITTTAKLLWGVYLILTFAQILALFYIGKMNWFDSICHTFSTIATGGFSTRTQSIGAFNSTSVDLIIIIFMFLSGINFALHYHALRGKPLTYLKDTEFRFYGILLLVVTTIVCVSIFNAGIGSISKCLIKGTFTTVALVTGTGFSSINYDAWPNAIRILLVGMMFFGGCAGSTTGGMKIIRINIMVKKMVREIRVFMRPSAVIHTKLNGKPVESNVVAQISTFFAIFVLIFAFGSFIMSFFTPDLETAVSSVVATLAGIGPGLSHVGPMENYSTIPVIGQMFLTFLMLLGRLELYTVLVLLLPSFWKR